MPMKIILVSLFVYTVTINAMNTPIILYESEEVTLTFQNKSTPQKTLVDDAWESASFDANNTFAIGEKVVIKNGLLSALNLNLPTKITKKIVTISDINGSDHTFVIASKNTDEHMNPIIKREITISSTELLGKIPQSLAESLNNSLN